MTLTLIPRMVTCLEIRAIHPGGGTSNDRGLAWRVCWGVCRPEHGISTIWSHDRDLRPFERIAVRDPLVDRVLNPALQAPDTGSNRATGWPPRSAGVRGH
jgi:hypothetical protein